MKVLILGNGPSLAEVDLGKVHPDVYVIGTNRIHKHPDHMRLDAYCLGDKRGNLHYREDLLYWLETGKPVIASWNMFYPWLSIDHWEEDNIVPIEKGWWDYPNLHPMLQCEHYNVNQFDFSRWHFPHICTYGGSVPIATQWAVKNLRPSEINYLGVDASYSLEGPDHFTEDYGTEEIDDRTKTVRDATIRKAHRIIEKECQDRGIEVFNLSRQSTVNAHKRRRIKDALGT